MEEDGADADVPLAISVFSRNGSFKGDFFLKGEDRGVGLSHAHDIFRGRKVWVLNSSRLGR